MAESFRIAANDFEHYYLKKGEIITDVLYAKKLQPLYGEAGYLKETIRLNLTKIKENGDLIPEGEVVLLPRKKSKKEIAEIATKIKCEKIN